MKKTVFTVLAASLLQLALVSSAFATNTLTIGQQLVKGQSLSSTDGRFSLAMQMDGNLVQYYGSNILWASGTNGAQRYWYDPYWGTYNAIYPYKLVLASDGYLGILDSSRGTEFWHADTQSWINNNYRIPMIFPTYGDTLFVQDDGNVVLYDTHSNSSWLAVWATDTGGR
ncbi:hypothetical protein JJB07_14375 [Tumebacillus sp. ITR2]|uniref:Bulb-type lectin domain-containing protein n=1 Tax=Tumebacillus amylolyticus TaxID=2801339 RepID=A0ABS1JE00_9BACL|nr:hypothetical protein [Tumebacillus amylolyticus]MBL0387823.1 hypothetical protein [Tumebacillus amylolyticus]